MALCMSVNRMPQCVLGLSEMALEVRFDHPLGATSGYINMHSWKYRLNLLVTVLFACRAYAYDIPTALANLTEDYADCAIYYSLSVQLAGSMNRVEEAKNLQATADHALKLYLTAMNDKSDNQLKSKAKLELHFKTNTQILKEEGMDRLNLMYSDRCKSMMENPDQRMNYWLNKK